MAELNATAGSDQLPNNADERSYASLANTRSFRRRVGERRISAPIRVVRSFVAALFDAIAGPEPSTWGDASNSTLTMSSDEFVCYISTNRYRLKENLTDEIAKNMFAEADLLNDGKLDQDEAANTAASCGIESVYLRYWCTLLNLFVDPYVQARAMPMRITKRHPCADVCTLVFRLYNSDLCRWLALAGCRQTQRPPKRWSCSNQTWQQRRRTESNP
jgi:hypothetical protein